MALTILIAVASYLVGARADRAGDNDARGVAESGPGPETATAANGPQRVLTTPEAMLELLTQLVSWGKPSRPAKSFDGRPYVQVDFDDGQGTGMVRAWLGPMSSPALGARPAYPCQPQADPERTCANLPGGTQATITQFPARCAQRTTVAVDHPDGTNVHLEIANCREWQGSTDPDGRQVVSADQAVAIAADARWGHTMDPAIVEAGRLHFPDLPTFRPPEPAQPVAPGIRGGDGDATFPVRKAASALCIAVRSRTGEPPVEQTVCAEVRDQRWRFDYPFFPDVKHVQIRHAQRNACLVTKGHGESAAVLVACDPASREQLWAWSWDSTWRGYRFENPVSGLCLAARHQERPIQATCGNWSDQLWLID